MRSNVVLVMGVQRNFDLNLMVALGPKINGCYSNGEVAAV